jgi:hypothetical protein
MGFFCYCLFTLRHLLPHGMRHAFRATRPGGPCADGIFFMLLFVYSSSSAAARDAARFRATRPGGPCP